MRRLPSTPSPRARRKAGVRDPALTVLAAAAYNRHLRGGTRHRRSGSPGDQPRLEARRLAAVRRGDRHARQRRRGLPGGALERPLADSGVLVRRLPRALLPGLLSRRLAGRIRASVAVHSLGVHPEGEIPARPYTKEELRGYLRHGREKCRRSIEALSDERSRERSAFLDGSLTALELMLYNLRHVQHHAGQLNLILRQKTQSAPRWVRRARVETP